MQKVFKSVLSLCLALAMCFGLTAVVNTAVTEYVVADAVTDYYAGITAKSGTALLGQLHDLIVETHKKYTSYDDCRNYGTTTDPGLDGKGVVEFYTHETIMSFVGGLGDWNREHVWCQSLSNGLWGTGGAGSDMHHIRPTESGLNSTRGNNKYGVVGSSGKEAWSRYSNGNNSRLGGYYVANSTFEPLDNVKGDVARIVMYVYTHYNNASIVGGTKESAKTHGNLPFTNVIKASSEAEAKKLLLEWNALDPVDEIETYRNEAVYEIQGNRNPFIDNSDYANAIWGDGTETIDPTPSGTLKSISLNATALNMKAGDTYDLKVTPNPGNASANVTWTSSNEEVATVSDGKVTAKSAGTTTVTATSASNSDIRATATVTVMSSSSSEITTGKATITISSFNNPGQYGFYTWNAGSINGTAYIYGSGGQMQFNNKRDSYYLASTTATPAPIKSITVKAADSNKEDRPWKLLTSSTAYSEVKGVPDSGNYQGTKTVTTEGVTWSVSGNDTYFALVYALEGATGVAYLESIEVEYESGGSSETPDELQSIAINPSALTLDEGDSTKLSIISVPSTATAEVNWTSSDTAVATVSEDGTVTAVGAGNATITATSKSNTAIKASATVTVNAESETPVENINIKVFHDAVAAINGDDALDLMFISIQNAVYAYKELSDEDMAAVSEDVEALRSAIASYNEAIRAYNNAADIADETALKGMGR